MDENKAQVIIPPNMNPPPEEHEVSAAEILARHYNTSVSFLMPSTGYMAKSADFVMNGVLWELKSPVSDSRRRCVSQRLDRATTQSRNVIFDGRRTKLPDDFLVKQLRAELEKRRSITRLIFIGKNAEILALK